MREIKFRAWDKEEKQMGNVLGFYLQENGWVDIEVLEERDDSDMKDKEYDDVEWRARLKYVDLMQYTGLKDKNGKKIYEGDILQIGSELVETVTWVDETTWNADKCPVNGWVNHESIYKQKPEIIGNIYSNPELLKTNQE